ncbi:MAG: hypothetical protein ABI878_06465 [Acidobacteriota bacterium]
MNNLSKSGAGRLLGLILLLAIAVLTPAAARAQGGPPMITDDTETVPKGHWEINSAFTVERATDGRLFGTPLMDINYGLSEHYQLKVEIPWLVLHQNGQTGVNGLGNVNIGVRWRFRDEKEHHPVALSMYPQVEFNTFNSSVNKGLVDKGPEFLMPFQIQTQVGKYGINGDIGYRFKRGRDAMIYGVVVGRELNKSLEVLAEIHGEGEAYLLRQSDIVGNVGFRLQMFKYAALIGSAGKSIRRHYDPRFIGYLGIQWTF